MMGAQHPMKLNAGTTMADDSPKIIQMEVPPAPIGQEVTATKEIGKLADIETPIETAGPVAPDPPSPPPRAPGFPGLPWAGGMDDAGQVARDTAARQHDLVAALEPAGSQDWLSAISGTRDTPLVAKSAAAQSPEAREREIKGALLNASPQNTVMFNQPPSAALTAPQEQPPHPEPYTGSAEPTASTAPSEIRSPPLAPPSAVTNLTATLNDSPAPVLVAAVELAERVEIIADTIASLRINSLSDEVQQLRDISQEIRALSDPSLKDVATRALRILTHLFDALGTQQGAQVIIAGAVAGILGAVGWPAVTAYGLSLAVWQGKDAFMAALSNLPKSSLGGDAAANKVDAE
jgi:hypothetical protein